MQRLLDLGWHIFPASPKNKAAMFKGAWASASNNPTVIENWRRKYGRCNWRLNTFKSNVLAIDIDKASELHECDGFQTMKQLCAKYGPLPRGPRLKTGGSGGLVAFFRHEGQRMRGGSNALGPGVDVSSSNGAVCPTLPPSRHPLTRGIYQWYRDHAPWEIELPAIPQWIVESLIYPEFTPCETRAYSANKLLSLYADDIIHAPSGSSNATINKASWKAGRLVASGQVGYAEALSTLLNAAMMRVGDDDRPSARLVIEAGLKSARRTP